MLHEHFQSSPARTEDPDQAQLFMIPVYLGRYYNWFWQQWSTTGKPLIPKSPLTHTSAWDATLLSTSVAVWGPAQEVAGAAHEAGWAAGSPWEIVKDCAPGHAPGSAECWWEKWMWAKGVSCAPSL